MSTTTTSTLPPWQQRTQAYRAAAHGKIPKEWLLSENYSHLLAVSHPTHTASVLSVPAECGILSPSEIDITENYTAVSLAAALAAGKLKALNVTTAFCKRAAVAQQITHCLTETMFDSALARAKELDEFHQREGRVVGPLHGVPISIKDSFKVKGVRSTNGYVSFLDHELEETNSALVEVLLKLGAVLYVKTNLPQTLMIQQALETRLNTIETADSENNIFLRTLNPHNPTLTAGGSSGGEGALVALRGSVIGIGTDIGGSIRIPALCCGIYGFKPSAHRIPYGNQAASGRTGSPGFPGVAGPMTNNFADLEILVKNVVQAKPWDHDASALAVPWRTNLSEKKKLRVGLLEEDAKWPCWPPIRRAISTAAEKLRAAGHEVVVLKGAPTMDEGLQLAYASYGLDNTKQAGRNIAASGEPLVESVRRTLETMTPKEGGWTLEEVFDLNVKKLDYFNRWNRVFVDNALDCIVGPGAQTTATPHDTYGRVPYTAAWNTLEYPGVIIPFLKADRNIDKDDLATADPDHPYSVEQIHGAPLHVQVVARRYMDEELLQASKLIDACLNE